MKKDDLLIRMRDIAFIMDNGKSLGFPNCDIVFGRCTVLYGPNGSGKTVFSRVLATEIEPSCGTRYAVPELSGRVEIVSFETGVKLIEAEKQRDESDLNGGAQDLGRTVGEYLGLNDSLSPLFTDLIKRFRIDVLLKRGLRALSSGELRKVLILHALMDNPLLLILDDPFDGLDFDSRNELTDFLEHLLKQCALLIITGRRKEAPGYTHQFIELSASDEGGSDSGQEPLKMENRELWNTIRVRDEKKESQKSCTTPLLELRKVRVAYQDEVILQDVDWRVLSGEAWKISGPNGAGKTTLMELVNGDNPKAYGQEIYLFGRRKGSGESVWDIKKRIGHVSPALHMRQLTGMTLRDVILSGFFDTLGLYDKTTELQIAEVREWARLFGIERYLDTTMRQVSFGIQRVALIVRALIKRPELLLLDEPCHGLDDYNTRLVLDAAQLIAEHNISTLLYVSHDPDHHVPAVTHNLILIPHKKGGYTAEVQEL